MCWRGLSQSPQPMMSEATYRRVFSEQRPFHDWEMSAPRPENARPYRWCGEKCQPPKPRPSPTENTPVDLP
jgi:hypothetical protein